eukprot:TRINITY_DN4104_c3_g2_i3.p1 TRINITY_DN4104_c3_g2~~TRINITY_DN4104_c3_g2_i3.p1  ORF type:complete len:116 (-),score=19.46 TRINITY_DN4104_c3_g2_i3:318-665(-)
MSTKSKLAATAILILAILAGLVIRILINANYFLEVENYNNQNCQRIGTAPIEEFAIDYQEGLFYGGADPSRKAYFYPKQGTMRQALKGLDNGFVQVLDVEHGFKLDDVAIVGKPL